MKTKIQLKIKDHMHSKFIGVHSSARRFILIIKIMLDFLPVWGFKYDSRFGNVTVNLTYQDWLHAVLHMYSIIRDSEDYEFFKEDLAEDVRVAKNMSFKYKPTSEDIKLYLRLIKTAKWYMMFDRLNQFNEDEDNEL